jgi:hypothetical protein
LRRLGALGLKVSWETDEVASSPWIDPLVERNQWRRSKMKRTKAQRVRAAACGPVLGLLLAVPVGGLLAGAAGADSTCYTGNNCAPTSTGITNTPAVAPADGPTAAATTSAAASTSSGLAFTGADIEEMAIIGVVAIGVGAVLVRGRRRTA